MASKPTHQKERDELLIHGFIRNEKIDIPVEIINLCLLWYHMALFVFKSADIVTLNEDKTVITQEKKNTSGEMNTSYGSIIMPSMNNEMIYEYKIKVSPTENQVGIGIDDAECECVDTYFIGSQKTYNYGLQCWNGEKSSEKDRWGTKYGDPCDGKKETIVIMTFNAKDSSLSFVVNGKDYGIAYDDIYKQPGLDYRLALYQNGGSTIEILGYCTKLAV